MDDFYTTPLYCDANELLHGLAAASDGARLAVMYCQQREDDEIRHYLNGLYRGPRVELLPSAALETYEMSHSGLRTYVEDDITGYYSVIIVDLEPSEGTVKLNVHSLQVVGETVHRVVSEMLETVGEADSFDVSELAFVDTVVAITSDAQDDGNR